MTRGPADITEEPRSSDDGEIHGCPQRACYGQHTEGGGIIGRAEAQISYRSVDGEAHQSDLSDAQGATLATTRPWRQFRWHRGQQHYSGFYWCATTGGHVVYESRLELARLLLADFDPHTVGIAAQPFLVEENARGRTRRHVPDYLLVANGLVTIVNVKPADRLDDPNVKQTLDWAGDLFERRGWRSEIWSGTDELTLTNVRFLAGYRRAALIDPQAVALVAESATSGESIGDLEHRLGAVRLLEVIRPAVLHLLWTSRLSADLTSPIGPRTVLGCTA
jgi:hypothetical protein